MKSLFYMLLSIFLVLFTAWLLLYIAFGTYGVFVAESYDPEKVMEERLKKGECWYEKEWDEKTQLWFVSPIPVCKEQK